MNSLIGTGLWAFCSKFATSITVFSSFIEGLYIGGGEKFKPRLFEELLRRFFSQIFFFPLCRHHTIFLHNSLCLKMRVNTILKNMTVHRTIISAIAILTDFSFQLKFFFHIPFIVYYLAAV